MRCQRVGINENGFLEVPIANRPKSVHFNHQKLLLLLEKCKLWADDEVMNSIRLSIYGSRLCYH